MDISNVFVYKRYLGIGLLILVRYKLQKIGFIIIEWQSVTLKSLFYFPKDVINITLKCQGIRICNNNSLSTANKTGLDLSDKRGVVEK